MKEPDIRVGFIIFNEEWKEQLITYEGHRKTAFNWIKQHNLINTFKQVVGKNEIYDEEDFLIEYIGAVKLYASNGKFYCRIPRMIDPNKSYLKKYYSNLGYKIISDGIYDEEKPKVYVYQYNKTVINNNNVLMYNPVKDGD